jgi:hypothetical protein
LKRFFPFVVDFGMESWFDVVGIWHFVCKLELASFDCWVFLLQNLGESAYLVVLPENGSRNFVEAKCFCADLGMKWLFFLCPMWGIE